MAYHTLLRRFATLYPLRAAAYTTTPSPPAHTPHISLPLCQTLYGPRTGPHATDLPPATAHPLRAAAYTKTPSAPDHTPHISLPLPQTLYGPRTGPHATDLPPNTIGTGPHAPPPEETARQISRQTPSAPAHTLLLRRTPHATSPAKHHPHRHARSSSGDHGTPQISRQTNAPNKQIHTMLGTHFGTGPHGALPKASERHRSPENTIGTGTHGPPPEETARHTSPAKHHPHRHARSSSGGHRTPHISRYHTPSADKTPTTGTQLFVQIKYILLTMPI
ncbi:hypothetical protein FKM82_013711 [Ascaphus truei]